MTDDGRRRHRTCLRREQRQYQRTRLRALYPPTKRVGANASVATYLEDGCGNREYNRQAWGPLVLRFCRNKYYNAELTREAQDGRLKALLDAARAQEAAMGEHTTCARFTVDFTLKVRARLPTRKAVGLEGAVTEMIKALSPEGVYVFHVLFRQRLGSGDDSGDVEAWLHSLAFFKKSGTLTLCRSLGGFRSCQ